jgi:hypothetical protein
MSKQLHRPVRFVDRDTVRDAVEHLRIARNLLVATGSGKAAARVRAALKSAEGAQRHIDGLHGRVFPPHHEFWRGYRPRVSIIQRLHPTLIDEHPGERETLTREAHAAHPLLCGDECGCQRQGAPL